MSGLTSANTEDKREKLQALSLAKECYAMKLEILINATVVDDAIKFVNEKKTGTVEMDRDKHEEKSDAIMVRTRNQIFRYSKIL